MILAMKNAKDVNVSVRLTQQEWEAAKALAESDNRPLSSWLRVCIIHTIRNESRP